LNIEEIRKNAPGGATHYKHWKSGGIDYFKYHDKSVFDVWYLEKWLPLPHGYFSYPLSIKPL
jgi:hypothetical protein